MDASSESKGKDSSSAEFQYLKSGASKQSNRVISAGPLNTQYAAEANQSTMSSAVGPITPTQHFHGIAISPRAQILTALYLTDPSIDRSNLIGLKGERAAGTCEWIRKDETYSRWYREGMLLWIWGGPGKGKTMLSIFLSEELEKEASTVYFFCRAEDEKRNTAIGVLRGLAWHLAFRFPKLVSSLLAFITGTMSGRSSLQHKDDDLQYAEIDEGLLSNKKHVDTLLASREILWKAVLRLIEDLTPERIFCVLDGLDECDEDSQTWLAEKFNTLNDRAALNTFKLIVVSRYMSGLRNATEIKLDTEHTEGTISDVKSFVQIKAQMLTQRIDLKLQLLTRVEDELLRRAEGSFLWVGFAMNELMKETTASGLSAALERIPRGLFEVYARIVKNIKLSREDLVKMLGWVALVRRPLSLEELASAIECRPSLYSTRIETAQTMVSACEPLLRITDDKVGLVHESARDYILQRQDSHTALSSRFQMEPERMHLEISQACLTSLTHKTPLLQYATEYWPHHARQLKTLAKDLLYHQKSFFGKDATLRNEWWRNYVTYRDNQDRTWEALDVDFSDLSIYYTSDNSEKRKLNRARIVPRLHLACRLGIEAWVEDILEKHRSRYWSQNPCKKLDPERNTPLHHAATTGHVQIATRLLVHGAKVNACNRNRYHAGHMAAYRGHEGVMDVLLSHGLCINAGQRDYPMLHIAARRNHVGVARLLLNHERRVDSPKGFGRKKASSAARTSSQASTHVTIVDDVDDSGRTALIHAVENGAEAVFLLLLERGANVNHEGPSAFTPLHDAAHRSDTMVKSLLERGANVNAVDIFGETPLIFASRHGSDGSVKLLLQHGADLNTESHDGANALYGAVERGHETTARLLLDHGANINARNRNGHTCLAAAVATRHFNVELWLSDNLPGLELSCKLGVDVNAVCDEGSTALHHAVRQGKGEQVVRLLLEHGANVHVANDHGYSALHYAACISDGEAVVKLLLDYGADVHAKTKDGLTALNRAAQKCRERARRPGNVLDDEDVASFRPIARLLIEHGAQLDLAGDMEGLGKMIR